MHTAAAQNGSPHINGVSCAMSAYIRESYDSMAYISTNHPLALCKTYLALKGGGGEGSGHLLQGGLQVILRILRYMCLCSKLNKAK